MPRSVIHVKREQARNDQAWAKAFKQLMRCCRKLDKLTKERKRIRERLSAARKREREYTARYSPLPSQEKPA